MVEDPQIRQLAYELFLEELPGLLETIEQELFDLEKDESRALKVNNLMRATHTIKGGAANVGLDAIETISHQLEDVLRALYNPELTIDAALKSLIFQSYESLRVLLSAKIDRIEIDETETLALFESYFSQLKTQLGDYLNGQEAFPSSEALGIDPIATFFETVVTERLTEIDSVIDNSDNNKIIETLREQAIVFRGMGRSFDLTGFIAIAETTLTALDRNPSQANLIAKIALKDFQTVRERVLSGQHNSVGEADPRLTKLANNEPLETNLLGEELKKIARFINEELPEERICFETVKCILGWFHCYENIPLEKLSLDAIVPSNFLDNTQESNLKIEQYIENWLNKFFQYIQIMESGSNSNLERKLIISKAILAVFKFQYLQQYKEFKNAIKIPIIALFTDKIERLDRKNKSSIPQQQKWLDASHIQDLIKTIDKNFAANLSTVEESAKDLLEDIWQNKNQLELFCTPVTETEEIDVKPVKENQEQKIETTTKIEKEKISSTIKVKLEGLEKINYLAGEISIEQNKNALNNKESQAIIEEVLAKTKQNQQILNQLCNWFDLTLMFPDNPSFLQTFSSLFYILPTNNSFCPQDEGNLECEKSYIQLEQYRQIFKVLKTVLEETNKSVKGLEKIKNHSKLFERSFKKKQRTIVNMREELIEARMTPLSNLFNRFPRLIEQLSNTYNKQVELKISGSNILVDKAIEQKLYQPLLHLVRNAFDHGIESKEKRLKSRKTAIGQIELSAYYQGSKTVVAVKDDGQGIDLEKIKKRAIERNLISQERAKKLSKNEILEYMFEPGFSTSSKVNNLSGRGVGLDIVRAQIEALKGNIVIESKRQQGTTFCLQIPLTLSIAKLMVCQAGGIIYSLVCDLVQKIIQPHPSQIEIFQQQKILHLSTETEQYAIPVYKLSELISYSKTTQKRLKKLLPTTRINQINPIVLLKRNDSFLGLEVERVIGKQELVIRPLGSALTPPSFVYGCSILSNSDLSLAIDGIALIEKMGKQQTNSENTAYLTTINKQLSSQNNSRDRLLPHKASEKGFILIVEDSISSQQTTATILQKAGYQAIKVGDGVAALEKLYESRQIKFIICDLDMPRMNGFEFLRALQQNPELSKIPAIVLTSDRSQTYRDLALQLGASGFLSKPCNERDLLDTLTTVLNPTA